MHKDIILIFGGDGKIAQSVVQKYLDEDCIVIAVDLKEKSCNPNFYKNSNYYYYSVDVTSPDDLCKLYEEIKEKFSYVNHVISSAGGRAEGEVNEILEMPFYAIDASIKLNITSHIYISKIFLPLLQNAPSNNKSILLFSSINALKSFDLPAYSAAKSGIYGFMNYMTRHIGTYHIRINSISPGTVASYEDIQDEDYYGHQYLHQMALNRFTSPDDIANACYALTHIATAVTGQNLVVDSGQIS